MKSNTDKIKYKSTLNFQKFINYFQPKFIDINGQKVVKKFPWNKILWSLVALVLISLIISLIRPDFQNWTKFWKSIGNFFEVNKVIQIGSAKITPYQTFLRSLQLLWRTISYSVLGTLLGIIISVPVALLSARNFIKNKFIYYPSRFIMSIIRAVPPVVFAFIFWFLFSSSLAATISIAIFVASIMSKWLYEDLDTYDVSAYAGIQSIGNGKIIAFKASIFPYLIKRIFSYGFYSFEMVIRFAAILSIVGISTIGELLADNYATINNYSHMSIVIWILVSFMVLLEFVNSLIKKYFLEFSAKHPNIDEKLPYEERVKSLKSQKPKTYIWKIIFAVALLALVAASLSQISWSLGNAVKIRQFKVGISKLFNPDWTLFQTWTNTKTNPVVLGMEALLVAFAATVIGFIFAFVIGILAAKNINKYFAYPFKLIIITVRAIPAFTFALLFLILSKDSKIFAGALALGFHSIGMLGKLVMESVEKIPNKVFQSLDSLGSSWFQKIYYGVVKAILPQALSNFLYRVELNFKTTVIIGAVGASNFGFQISIYSSQFQDWDKLSSYLIFTIITVLIIEQISNLIRNKLIKGYFFSENSWVKKQMNKSTFLKALAVSLINEEKFLYEIKYANYLVAKYNLEKLKVLADFNRNKSLNLENYSKIVLEEKAYHLAFKHKYRELVNSLKKIKADAYRKTKNNISKEIKRFQFIKRHRIASKSANIAGEKYLESFSGV
ncbi:PhnE/PtxC family ABC transporter permease [Mycoplasma phocoeninasale]|uniref:PhnE/PtxC family ABC transporter permease n=1 Tax=Mycoplasma phocoeninasale TaxID=2726117 RepID=UPI0019681F20|nr:ABC transporter permease subunit [Mycoplasma phocoeninasale]MBN0970689.1 ABC transporter permease subunit [Mycoplasma phocoeninasale]